MSGDRILITFSLEVRAIAFSIGFYDGLGAGKSVEIAYQLSCNAIDLAVNPNSESSRNHDKIARIITVAPTNETYDDGAILVTEKTKISNGHLAAPKGDRQEDINDGWYEVKRSPNELNWHQLFEKAILIVKN